MTMDIVSSPCLVTDGKYDVTPQTGLLKTRSRPSFPPPNPQYFLYNPLSQASYGTYKLLTGHTSFLRDNSIFLLISPIS